MVSGLAALAFFAEDILLGIDRSGYLGLEEFVRDQLILEGLRANLTQRTGDGGADIIVRDSLIYPR